MARLSCLQLNMHKAMVATTHLASELVSRRQIAFLQEPYTAFNKVVMMPKGYDLFQAELPSLEPRTALLVPREIPAQLVEHLTNRDACVVTATIRGLTYLLASVYLDILHPPTPAWLSDIVSFADDKGYALVLAADTNAHSHFFGPDSNARGELLDLFLLSHGLVVENLGFHPTFHSRRNGRPVETHIDATFSKRVSELANWRVCEEFNGSDHYTIRFDLGVFTPLQKQIRPWAQADWPVFTTLLDKDWPRPERMSMKKLDKLVDSTVSEIVAALDEACPLKLSRPPSDPAAWFTEELLQEHLRVRRQFRRYMRHKSSAEHFKYQQLLRRFRKHCRRARTRSWRKYVSFTPSMHTMAKLADLVQHRQTHRVGLLRHPDGTISDSGEDTLQALFRAHFPFATPYPDVAAGEREFPPYSADRSELSSVISAKYPEFVTPVLTRRALLMFKPHKAPGPDTLKPVVFRYFPWSLFAHISFLYQCCLHFQYNPRQWQRTWVIFLPKPGKSSYADPKSFRPICLSNYLLKGLERLITWRMDDSLKVYPIHSKQHGFQKGKGTELAISNLVSYAEPHVFFHRCCIAIFLDITSAYDSMDIHHIRTSLYLHGGDDDLVEWYFHSLGHRTLEADMHGASLRVRNARGFPQGGGGVCQVLAYRL